MNDISRDDDYAMGALETYIVTGRDSDNLSSGSNPASYNGGRAFGPAISASQ